MTDRQDRIDAALGERYRLLREIGAGGVAQVYLADDLKHGRRVAVKVLRSELSGSISAGRFLREIQITAALSHPHIVPLFDSGEKDGIVYYVMPQVEGETLRERLAREGQLPIAEAVRLATEIAEALAYAHGRGVVHRDIKPANVLLTGGHALVADFGVARALAESARDSDLTSSGAAIGTPMYMSPEQAGGHHAADARSDIYSLGCLLYEMLAGEPPFRGPTPTALLARHIADPPPSIRVVRPAVSEALEAVVWTALAKLPADRFPSASAFAAALHAAHSEAEAWTPSDPQSYTPRTTQRTRPARPARRWSNAALAGIALAPIVVAAVVLVSSRPPTAPTLSSNKVVVFPLADRSAAGEGMGAEVALIIGMAMEQTEPLKWIDGWSLLTPEQRANVDMLTDSAMRTLARGRGAAWFVEGAALRHNDSVSVSLSLYDVAGDSLVQRVSRTGHAAEITADRLGLQAVVGLLPTLVDPGRRIDLDHIAGRDPRAITLWIQGEREYRMARFGPALELFERAVEADSQLAIAALKGAQAAGWHHEPDRGERLVALALGHEPFLTERQRALVRGFQAYAEGRADDAVDALRSALEGDPEWAESWMLLGETYQHLIPSDIRVPDSAREAFARAWELDPNFVPPLLHLVEYVVRDGDAAEAAALVARLEASGAEAAGIAPRRLMLTCLQKGADGLDWMAAARDDALAVLEAAKQLGVGAAHPACAEAAYRALLRGDAAANVAWGALQGLQGLLIMTARGAEARDLLREAAAGGTPAARLFHVLDAFAGAPTAADADSLVALVTRLTNGSFAGVQPRTQWLVGTWLAYRGRLAELGLIESALVAAVAPGATRFALALAAHRSLVEGETMRSMALLATVPLNAPRVSLAWDPGEGLPIEQLALACLHLARGQADDAHRIAALLEHPQPASYLPFLPASLRIQLEAARLMGERAVAASLESRLQQLGFDDEVDRGPCTPFQETRR